jgi:hypothetical protein
MSGMTACRAFVLVCVLLASRPAFAQERLLTAAQPGVQGFSIVLVLGDLQGGPTPDNIPPAARAALGDLKDFLPYKSYRVLDTAWILGSTTQLFRAKSRLRGADDQTYEVNLTSSPVGAPAPPSLQMKFVMQDRSSDTFGTSDAAHKEAQMKTEVMQLTAARAALEKSLQSSDPSESPDERRQRQAAIRDKMRDITISIDTMQNQLQSVTAGQTLIDTSFNMRLGETVVVGTSRVRGDKALIALLTAVRK